VAGGRDGNPEHRRDYPPIRERKGINGSELRHHAFEWVADYVATWLTKVAIASLFTPQVLYLLFVSRISGDSAKVKSRTLSTARSQNRFECSRELEQPGARVFSLPSDTMGTPKEGPWRSEGPSADDGAQQGVRGELIDIR
jgi:hypothetical protein